MDAAFDASVDTASSSLRSSLGLACNGTPFLQRQIDLHVIRVPNIVELGEGRKEREIVDVAGQRRAIKIVLEMHDPIDLSKAIQSVKRELEVFFRGEVGRVHDIVGGDIGVPPSDPSRIDNIERAQPNEPRVVVAEVKEVLPLILGPNKAPSDLGPVTLTDRPLLSSLVD